MSGMDKKDSKLRYSPDGEYSWNLTLDEWMARLDAEGFPSGEELAKLIDPNNLPEYVEVVLTESELAQMNKL